MSPRTAYCWDPSRYASGAKRCLDSGLSNFPSLPLCFNLSAISSCIFPVLFSFPLLSFASSLFSNQIAPIPEPKPLSLPALITIHPDWLMFPDRSCVWFVVTQLVAPWMRLSLAAVCCRFSSPGEVLGGNNAEKELCTATQSLTFFFKQPATHWLQLINVRPLSVLLGQLSWAEKESK